MKYGQHTFDVVLDKATLDCFFCGENSYDQINGILKQVYKVLKPNGVFVFISYGNPERRLIHLQKYEDFDWEIRVEKIIKMRQAPGDGETQTEELAEPDYQYIYICVKRGTDPFIETETETNELDSGSQTLETGGEVDQP